MTDRGACEYCKRALDDRYGGYFFACHKCGAAYCYVHMARHEEHLPPKVPVPA